MVINVSADPLCSKSGSRLVPPEWRPRRATAFLPHDGVQPQPHLVGPLGGNQQHAASPFDGMSDKGLPGRQRGRQIKRDECLAGTPLPGKQTVSNCWK